MDALCLLQMKIQTSLISRMEFGEREEGSVKFEGAVGSCSSEGGDGGGGEGKEGETRGLGV